MDDSETSQQTAGPKDTPPRAGIPTSTTGEPARVEPPAAVAIEEPARGRALFRVARVVAILACVAMLVGLFLPYLSARGDRREYLLGNPNGMVSEELSLTNEQLADVSLVEYARIYRYIGNTWDSSWYLYVGLAIAIAATALVALLFAFGKKPFGVLVFSLFSLGFMLLVNWDADYRGLTDGAPYIGGYGRIVLLAGACVAIVAAVCMAVARFSARRAQKKAIATATANGLTVAAQTTQKGHGCLTIIVGTFLVIAVAFVAFSIVLIIKS